MDRTIKVEVNGNYIRKDNSVAGVQGEANGKTLQISFDAGWDGFAKNIVFYNAHGQNPVEIVLTTDKLTDIENSLLEYSIPVPAEAMEFGGELEFVIGGYQDNVRLRSVTDSLSVRFSHLTSEPAPVSPTQAEQLQGQIEAINRDIQKATQAAGSAEDAANSAKNAADSAGKAEKAKEAIENMTVSVKTLGEEETATVEKTENADGGAVHLEFGLPKGASGPPGGQGPPGPQGPRGYPGVAVQTTGYVTFNVTDDGILQCTYTGDEKPNYSINQNGHLILDVLDE